MNEVTIGASLGSLVIFSVATALTPGPNNIYLATLGARGGFKLGLPYLLGIPAGMLLLNCAIIGGLLQVLLQYPDFEKILTPIAAIFMIFVAWLIARSKPISGTGLSEIDADNSMKKSGESEKQIGFVGSLFFQLINPKAWATSLSVATLYLNPVASNLFLLGFKFFVFVFVTTLCSTLWLYFGMRLRYFLKTEKSGRYFNYIMAALLVFSVIIAVVI